MPISGMNVVGGGSTAEPEAPKTPALETPVEPEKKSPSLGIDPQDSEGESPKKAKTSEKSEKKESADKKPEKKESEKKEKAAARKRKARLDPDTEIEWDDDGGDGVDLSNLTITRKVDGKDVEVPISQLGKDWELRRASYDRLEKNNQREQRFVTELRGLAENRGSLENFLREHVGIQDPYDWAMKGLQERIAEEQLAQSNPTEWKQKQQQRMRQQMEIDQRRQQRLQQQQYAALQEREAGQRFVDAITTGRKEHGLNSSLGLGLLQVMENRFGRMGRDPRAEVSALLSETADVFKREITEHVRELNDEQLLELLGPVVLARLNAFQVKRAKAGMKNGTPPEAKKGEAKKPESQSPRKFKSEREITRALYGHK